MDSNQIVEAVNSLNATVRRLIFAFECDRGLEMGRNGYYKKDEAEKAFYELRFDDRDELERRHDKHEEEELHAFIYSKASKAERKAFFQKQIELLEGN